MLLEKPSMSNAFEAEILFRRNSLKQHHGNGQSGSPPVWLESLHTNFHPTFRKSLGLIEPTNVLEVHATLELMKNFSNLEGDIRMDYGLAGGSPLDCGAYAIFAIRQTCGEEPLKCVEVCFCSLVLLYQLALDNMCTSRLSTGHATPTSRRR